jgi:hypothetical protein
VQQGRAGPGGGLAPTRVGGRVIYLARPGATALQAIAPEARNGRVPPALPGYTGRPVRRRRLYSCGYRAAHWQIALPLTSRRSARAASTVEGAPLGEFVPPGAGEGRSRPLRLRPQSAPGRHAPRSIPLPAAVADAEANDFQRDFDAEAPRRSGPQRPVRPSGADGAGPDRPAAELSRPDAPALHTVAHPRANLLGPARPEFSPVLQHYQVPADYHSGLAPPAARPALLPVRVVAQSPLFGACPALVSGRYWFP